MPVDPVVNGTIVRSINNFLFNEIIIDGGEAIAIDVNAVIIKNVPLTSINDIQSLVLYNRISPVSVTDRIIGMIVELYYIDDDPSLLVPLSTTTPISVGDRRYRFDYPSIDTYTIGFSTGDSITQVPAIGSSDTISDVAIVNVFDPVVDVSGGLTCDTITTTGNVDISGSLNVETSLTTNQLIVNDDLYFDTIVIRRPTNIGTGKFTGIREVELFVNDVNVLPNLVSQSTFNVDGTPLQDISNIPFCIDWSDKTLDPNLTFYYASKVVDEIIDSDSGHLYSAYWGIIDGVGVENTDVGLYIPMSDKINIKDIQSAIIYNRANGNDNFIGCAIELYNRSNDPNLETPLSSTNVITTAEDVYRFDYPAIDTYTGVFSDTNSISQIASGVLALKEVVSEFAESANITGTLRCAGRCTPLNDKVLVRRALHACLTTWIQRNWRIWVISHHLDCKICLCKICHVPMMFCKIHDEA